MSSTKNKNIAAFRKVVWNHYHKEGRHTLPWRKTRSPYAILVSEIMLQQTQVDRVVPKYHLFLKKFPNVRALARASLRDVLIVWQGLGYNRRAKYLHEAAKAIVAQYGGRVPRDKSALIALPGIGLYTASAVHAFSWNEPDIFIETNIRAAFIQYFFSRSKKVTDAQLLPYIQKSLDEKNPRKWYFALMDYGTHLKRTEGNAGKRSAHHARQKPFKGSDREVRGAIVKALSKKSGTIRALARELGFSGTRVRKQLHALAREGIVTLSRERASLPA